MHNRIKILLLVMILPIIINSLSCEKQPIFGRPEIVKDVLSERIGELGEMNEQAYKNYKNGRSELMRVYGWEIIRCINHTADYIDTVSYYEGVLRHSWGEIDEFNKLLWNINDELSKIASGEDAPVNTYIGENEITDESVERARDTIDAILNRTEEILDKLPIRR